MEPTCPSPPARGVLQRAIALLTLLAILAWAPTACLTHAAQPVTMGDWMTMVYATAQRPTKPDPTAIVVESHRLGAPPAPAPAEQLPPESRVMRPVLPGALPRKDQRDDDSES